MRIIAGTAGRTRIRVPDGVTRPTTDFVRQAIFSILGERVVDARVLDLFAGSGAVGLEALSRGARRCVFVDDSRRAAAAIEENLRLARLAGGRVVRADVFRFLERETDTHDLVFADPPYARSAADPDSVARILVGGHLLRVLAPAGWLVAEVPAEAQAAEPAGWKLHDRRSYGGSSILLYGPCAGA